MQKMLHFSEEVQSAIQDNKPIVALESTIIAHGMPYPQNKETASSLSEIIRSEGAVPATIAVLDGKIKVGLEEAEIEMLATEEEVMKLSRRDLPYAISEGKHGATTVAATMIIAEQAGIKVFATGGIGGVHRGAEDNWDVSADLTELQRTSVAVVSAGAKAILDIPATLEYLETMGVPVIGVGTHDFPSFYSRKSGQQIELRMDEPDQIARFLDTKWRMGLNGGVLIANPIPAENAIPFDAIEEAIQQSIDEAQFQAIKGKRLTPFLLSKIKTITEGKSLAANVALVKNNALLAARIATALNGL